MGTFLIRNVAKFLHAGNEDYDLIGAISVFGLNIFYFSKYYITLYIVARKKIGPERKYDYLFSSSP